MTKNDKLNLICFFTFAGIGALIIGVMYLALFYEPTHERYYFSDMYKEQQAERERAAEN